MRTRPIGPRRVLVGPGPGLPPRRPTPRGITPRPEYETRRELPLNRQKTKPNKKPNTQNHTVETQNYQVLKLETDREKRVQLKPGTKKSKNKKTPQGQTKCKEPFTVWIVTLCETKNFGGVMRWRDLLNFTNKGFKTSDLPIMF